LIEAAQSFPAFGCTGNVTQRKLDLAAFLAQSSQETSGWWSPQPYIWGYVFSTEECAPNDCGTYCSDSATYPCDGSVDYYGRGPLQLSWNYNYGQVSQALFNDVTVLLDNPDLLLTNGTVAFQTSLWFWMTPQSPKPSCHDVMTGGYTPTASEIADGQIVGFGLTTDIINGGIECDQVTPQSVTNRVGYFNTYTAYFGLPTQTNEYCNNMDAFN